MSMTRKDIELKTYKKIIHFPLANIILFIPSLEFKANHLNVFWSLEPISLVEVH